MSYTVYIAINIRNGKRYIGVTGKGIARRSKAHWHKARAGGRECPRFYDALRKYGPAGFAWKELFSCTDRAEAYRKEFELVRDLKPEYNAMDGGVSAPVGAGSNKREIVCLEDGIEHASAADAAHYYSADMSEICKVLRGESRWTKGLHFYYRSEALSEDARRGLIREIDNKFIRGMRRVSVRKENRNAPLAGRDVSGRSAAGPLANRRMVMCVQDGVVFESVSDASRHYDLDTGSISRICRGIRKMAGGRSFVFVDAAPKAVN